MGKRELDPYLRDDVFRVNGEEVHNLTLLGKIVATDISSTSQMYTIDDGTGTVEVKMWVDTDDAADGAATNNRSDLKVGAYARVYGHLRAFQGVRNVIAFNMRPVTDFNEITYHFLEVVYCNSHNGVRAAAAAAAPGAGGAGAGAGVDGNAYAAPAAATMGNAAAAPAAAAAGDINQQVFAIFNGPQGASDQGVRVNDVVTQLNGRWTEEQVRGAVDHLVNEGHLYSTIDDDHFKSTLL